MLWVDCLERPLGCTCWAAGHSVLVAFDSAGLASWAAAVHMRGWQQDKVVVHLANLQGTCCRTWPDSVPEHVVEAADTGSSEWRLAQMRSEPAFELPAGLEHVAC